MADRSLTLLEIHLGDARIQIGPKTLRAGSEESASENAATGETDPDTPAPDDGCPWRSTRGVALLVVLLLGALAALAWVLRSGDNLDAAESLDELAE